MGTKHSMPADLEEVYLALWQEVSWVHVVWNQYRVLFMKSEEQASFLGKMAPGFFRVCHDSLLDDVVLTLCRLTDPLKSCGRENMVMQRVADTATAAGNDEAFTARITGYLKSATEGCGALREHRNQRLAHADYDVTVHLKPLAGFSQQKIEEVLKSVRDFINTIAEQFGDAPGEFQLPGVLLGEADTLVRLLRQADAYKKHAMAGRVNPREDGIVNRLLDP
jgi:hypothetical protein